MLLLRASGVALAGLLCAACDVDLRAGFFKCEADTGCPRGWACGADRLCYPRELDATRPDPVSDADAAARAQDAAADGGRVASPDAGGTDASQAPEPDPTRTPDEPVRDAAAGPEPADLPDAGPGPDPMSSPDSGALEPDAGPACTKDATRACYSASEATRGRGACRDGEQRCEHGQFSACSGAVVPLAESCNGIDDDCDGATDESTDTLCYSGASGCSAVGAGFDCIGACAAGRRICRNGQYGVCETERTPGPESCTEPPLAAADEDCDDKTDEGCVCEHGQTLSCYPGPAGTLQVGACAAGWQTCSVGAWGACAGAVVPADETCANPAVDDDCDGTPDDIPGLGAGCTGTLPGACASGTLQCQSGELACVTPAPGVEACNGLDDDCDGIPDNGFNFNADAANCGGCGIVCATGQTCCAGECRGPLICGTRRYVCGTECPDLCPRGNPCP